MNELKVHERESILSLWKTGWSARRIARELGCNRETVSRYIRLDAGPKPATPTPGTEAVAVATACEAARRNLSVSARRN